MTGVFDQTDRIKAGEVDSADGIWAPSLRNGVDGVKVGFAKFQLAFCEQTHVEL